MKAAKFYLNKIMKINVRVHKITEEEMSPGQKHAWDELVLLLRDRVFQLDSDDRAIADSSPLLASTANGHSDDGKAGESA